MGKVVSRNNSIDLEITGIVEDPPSNSHLSFTGIISFSTLYPGERTKWMDSWIGNINYYTYLRTTPGTRPNDFEIKINETVQEKAGQSFKDYGFSLYARVQSINDIHLRSDFQHDISSHENLMYVYIFIIVAALLSLLISFLTVSIQSYRASIANPADNLRTE